MNKQEINWEERLWQLSTQLYCSWAAKRADVDMETLAKASINEAKNFLNVYVKITTGQ